MKDKINRSEKLLQSTQEWIKSADQKVSIYLAFIGVLLSLFLPNFMEIFFARIKCNTLPTTLGVVITISFILLVIAIIKALVAIIPKLGDRKNKQLLYFGSISNFEIKQFKKDFSSMPKKEYLNQLMDQIHINSRIAYDKHISFRNSLILFLVSILLLMASEIFIIFY